MESGETLICMFCHLTAKLPMKIKIFVIHARVHLDVATYVCVYVGTYILYICVYDLYLVV
jgi:hypothetical protein